MSTVIKIEGQKFADDVFPFGFLIKWLIKHKAIVSGSVVLKFITEGDYEPNDVDILVPVSDIKDVDRLGILLHDYLVETCPDLKTTTHDNRQVNQYDRSIISRTDVFTRGKQYQFLFTIISPLQMIRKWDLDICQNFWDPMCADQVTAFYFDAIFKRQASFLNKTWRPDARQERYERRGYRFLPATAVPTAAVPTAAVPA